MGFNRELTGIVLAAALALGGCRNSRVMEQYDIYEDAQEREIILSIDPESALVVEDIFNPKQAVRTVRHYSGDTVFELIYVDGRLESNETYRSSSNETYSSR